MFHLSKLQEVLDAMHKHYKTGDPAQGIYLHPIEQIIAFEGVERFQEGLVCGTEKEAKKWKESNASLLLENKKLKERMMKMEDKAETSI